MEVDWTQLSQIFYVLIIFFAPAIIGAFNRRKKSGAGETTSQEPRERKDRSSRPSSKLDEFFRSQGVDLDISLEQEAHSPPKKEVSVVKEVALPENAHHRSLNVLERMRGEREGNDSSEQRSSLHAKPVALQSPKKVSPKPSIKKMIVWREILGPPKASEYGPW